MGKLVVAPGWVHKKWFDFSLLSAISTAKREDPRQIRHVVCRLDSASDAESSELGAKTRMGLFFASSLKRANVGVTRLQVAEGSTARSVILTCEGQRTMRTCMENAARLSPDDIVADDYKGVKWALFSAYGLYSEGLLLHAMTLAKQAGVKLAFDLASFEVVRHFRSQLLQLLEDVRPDFLVCNEDEGAALIDRTDQQQPVSPESSLAFLADRADIAAVTLGARGCLVRQVGHDVTVKEPAASNVTVLDATGAGDLFTAGFLFGIMRAYPLQQCARIGCLAGGAVVQSLGAELTKDNWRWLFARLHGELAAAVVRDSASAVSSELLACYALIERLGRGVVYYGSARLKEASPHWERARQLGWSVSQLLGSTTWSGGGPGMMQAASLGAMDQGGPVGGVRIMREAGTTVLTASYLPKETTVFCRFLAPRKVALVDAGVRASPSDKTAYIFLPGGLGTMDELFEVLTLVQLGKLGSKHPVPVILCNYDGFYSDLMGFLKACDKNGTVGASELHNVIIAADNDEVLSTLAQFYGLPYDKPAPACTASEWISGGRHPSAEKDSVVTNNSAFAQSAKSDS